MSTQQHDPQVMPMAEVADRWVVRCDCGCSLYEEFAERREAEERAGEAGTAHVDRADIDCAEVDHTDTVDGLPEPI
ncbi:hypothetical protein [Pseudonocardia phyllosphaerae]|uniref:hypothetical protein n=1 Tax=Pseudonocardia phyllosphaerae TaxID=3390502 RepID=UPI00397E0D42